MLSNSMGECGEMSVFSKDDTYKSRSVFMESLEGQHGPLFKDDMHKNLLCLLSFMAQENLAAGRWRLTWFRKCI